MPKGLIIKGIGGFYYVKAENSDTIYECKARGAFRKDKTKPLPGDRVEFTATDAQNFIGFIENILDRKSELTRPAVANVDQVAIVAAVKSPSPDFLLMDKLIISAELKKLDIILCFNKSDLDQDENLNKMLKAYRKTNYPIIVLSSKLNIGYDDLKEFLNDKTTVFAGQSGVGKSTILNRILQNWVMKTGNVSKKIERGKHTTRHAELLQLEFGGYVIDTPGFSSFEIEEILPEELENYYIEFADLLGNCRFNGCSHIAEPDCAVKKAVEDGKISQDRYDRYRQFYDILMEAKNNQYKNKKRNS